LPAEGIRRSIVAARHPERLLDASAQWVRSAVNRLRTIAPQSWKLLAEAEYWEHLAEAQMFSHFKECNVTSLRR
jgi:hypothetical protein